MEPCNPSAPWTQPWPSGKTDARFPAQAFLSQQPFAGNKKDREEPPHHPADCTPLLQTSPSSCSHTSDHVEDLTVSNDEVEGQEDPDEKEA